MTSSKLSIYLAGTGLIGSELLKQLSAHGKTVQLDGVMDVSRMLLSPAIPFGQAAVQLAKRGTATHIERFMEAIPEGAVFVDCTASGEIASLYERLLARKVSVVTPNKKANTGAMAYYAALRKMMRLHGAWFLYDTNVGAGLPIIKTVQRMVRSEEKNFQIDAVLSGTLSYIFNTFSDSTKPFAEVVRDAQKKGFTEPDPRDDLSGLDMARKMLILMREIGLKAELSDVQVEALLPKAIMRAKDVTEFYALLEKFTGMEAKREKARLKGKVLRFVASLRDGKARLKLIEADARNPFYALSHCDNMVAIHTDHYIESPLVIRGPGAGAKVTAAGILSNILSLR